MCIQGAYTQFIKKVDRIQKNKGKKKHCNHCEWVIYILTVPFNTKKERKKNKGQVFYQARDILQVLTKRKGKKNNNSIGYRNNSYQHQLRHQHKTPWENEGNSRIYNCSCFRWVREKGFQYNDLCVNSSVKKKSFAQFPLK